MAKEFATLRAMMVESLNYAGTPLSDFDYQPENASQFYHLITDNTTQYCEQRCFAKHLNISKLVDMFIASSPAQMNDIRRAFTNLYGDNGTAKNLYDDVGSISELLLCLKERTGAAITESKLDKVQILQYDWLVECLGKWLTMIQNIETV